MLALCPKCGLLMRVYPSNTCCRHCAEAEAAKLRAAMREAQAARAMWEALGEPEPVKPPPPEDPEWKKAQDRYTGKRGFEE